MSTNIPKNGKSERMIRHLNNTMFCIFTHRSLPSIYWVDALHTSAYLHNILPSPKHKFLTPTTRLYGWHPSYARANMSDCKPCITAHTNLKHGASSGPPLSDGTIYRTLARVLQYLTFTRPDITYAVQQNFLFMHAWSTRASHAVPSYGIYEEQSNLKVLELILQCQKVCMSWLKWESGNFVVCITASQNVLV